jgi:hypothetical protein
MDAGDDDRRPVDFPNCTSYDNRDQLKNPGNASETTLNYSYDARNVLTKFLRLWSGMHSKSTSLQGAAYRQASEWLTVGQSVYRK